MDDVLLEILPTKLADDIKKSQQHICPKCDGPLDSGWECADCGFDAKPLIRPQSN